MTYSDTTLVLPTLNEREALPILISAVLRRYDGIRILVVDDGSEDGTLSTLSRFSRNKRIGVIERKGLGRSPGLTASIIDGIMSSSTRFVIVMDSDMQHPPEKIREIRSALASGSQIAVGVRAGVRQWPIYRKLVSKLLGSIGHAVLLLSGKKTTGDIFSGFFGIERKLARGIILRNRERFVGDGYKFLFDLLKCIDAKDGIAISEVGYDFGNRRFGRSKAGARQAAALIRSFVT